MVLVLSRDDLHLLSTAALRARLGALQRMPGRMPDQFLAAVGRDMPIARIACKTSPHWRDAYHDVRDVLSTRAGVARERVSS